MKRIYFDNAATTPIDPAVIEVMREAMQKNYGNPSSIHAEGRIARAAIEDARKRVARLLGASIGEIFFTSCGTESNNMVLKGAVRDLGVERIITSRIEHHAVLHTVEKLAGVTIDYVELEPDGGANLTHLEALLRNDDRKTLVSLMHANNEVGALNDLEAIGNICEEHGALFHSDTVQTIGYYPIDLSKLKVHFISGSAHKFYGPKGVGFVYINGDHILHPFIDGGAQERNMRGGTENIYGILGLAKALELVSENREANRTKITELRDYLRSQLLENFEDLVFNGDPDRGHYKLLSVAFPPSPRTEMLLLNLDIAGVSVSGGSACSSGADAGSHVIEGLNGDPDRKTIRFSFSHYNTREEVDFVVEQLRALLPVKEGVEN